MYNIKSNIKKSIIDKRDNKKLAPLAQVVVDIKTNNKLNNKINNNISNNISNNRRSNNYNNKSSNYYKLLAFSKDHGGLWRNSQSKLGELIRNNIQLRNIALFIKVYDLYGFEKTKKLLKGEEKSFDTTNTDMKNRYNKMFHFVNTYNI